MLDPSWLLVADLNATLVGIGAILAGAASMITAIVGARLSVKKGRKEGYQEARRRWRRAEASHDREQPDPSGDDGYVSDDLSDW